jgi:hypothetical protein
MSVSEVGVRKSEIGDRKVTRPNQSVSGSDITVGSSVIGHLSSVVSNPLHIALLTGGRDKPYALGMAAALTSVGIRVDFIGSDEVA